MDIKNFFHKILSGNKAIVVPTTIKEAFSGRFNSPLNTEWAKVGDQYEAVFYKDELEHIARYNVAGVLQSLKVNLQLDTVPQPIRETARQHGELMNAITIQRANETTYELIVRDDQLTRFTLLLNSNGEVIEKEKL
ncbi:hypothetical protein [Gaoshiqia sediminis]|uniref:Uncharacterized protein n=1 Tax=Gaoshiqia sediminis TaxID=2986998 RepID=A0AA41YBT9_9BACT|nr:hypothetical protein [Gaoshiqia sediminis]MCW0483383.1 hypothetical protein [Gaoshiqia sediminis]